MVTKVNSSHYFLLKIIMHTAPIDFRTNKDSSHWRNDELKLILGEHRQRKRPKYVIRTCQIHIESIGLLERSWFVSFKRVMFSRCLWRQISISSNLFIYYSYSRYGRRRKYYSDGYDHSWKNRLLNTEWDYQRRYYFEIHLTIYGGTYLSAVCRRHCIHRTKGSRCFCYLSNHTTHDL